MFDPSYGTPSPERGPRHVDPGYESDDSDSTIDAPDPYRRRDRYPLRHRASSTRPPAPASSFAASRADPYSSTLHHRSHPGPIGTARDSDSESTIELPPRFDAQGHHLSGSEDESLMGHMGQFLSGIPNVFSWQ
jgi:hypothetical protein